MFSQKALANAVAPGFPILLPFLVLVRSTREKEEKYLPERSRVVMLLFSCKALANALAPVSPILLSFLVLVRSTREEREKILTIKAKSGDAFVFTQSIGQCTGPCVSHIVVFFGVGEMHKRGKRKNTYDKGQEW